MQRKLSLWQEEMDFMERIEILRKLFTEQELERTLSVALCKLQKELNDNDYRMAAFRSHDIAHIYDILENKKSAEHYYRSTIRYLDRAEFQPLWIRIECLNALGDHKEALEVLLNDPHHTRLGLAELYEKVGKYDTAREIYAELATEQSKKAERSKVFQSLFLQHASDLWERAQNTEEARKCNQRAVYAWEKMKDDMKRPLVSIEKAWLYEEVGYIYEKAGKFETAMKYYEKAESKYELAYTEDVASAETHYVDGDWGYYIECFYFQLPEIRMIKLRFEYFMKFDFRRIKYRILKLKEKMRVQH
jgi:tetratricopeptide (TPR) repeat protein